MKPGHDATFEEEMRKTLYLKSHARYEPGARSAAIAVDHAVRCRIDV